jgi:hypothetical protein
MRVLVCGGRDFGEVPMGCPENARHSQEKRAHAERSLLHATLATVMVDKGISAIIHGGARGADSEAGYWARRNLIPEIRFDADWKALGNAAGPIRNQRMVDEGKPDLVIAFPGGTGTADMIRRAERTGIHVMKAA